MIVGSGICGSFSSDGRSIKEMIHGGKHSDAFI